jgi:hypothetical protein
MDRIRSDARRLIERREGRVDRHVHRGEYDSLPDVEESEGADDAIHMTAV